MRSVANDFLNSEEIRESIVECTFYLSCLHICPTVSETCTPGPSGIIQTAVVSVHSSEGVVAVGSSQREPMAGGELAWPEVVVVASTHGRHGEVVVFERKRRLHRTCLVVQTTNERITELSALSVI